MVCPYFGIAKLELMFYNVYRRPKLSVINVTKTNLREWCKMDYREQIIKMIGGITNTKVLKLIYNFVLHHYKKNAT